MVGVGVVEGCIINIQGSGVTDERRGVGEQNTLQRVLLLEKDNQYEAITENSSNGKRRVRSSIPRDSIIGFPNRQVQVALPVEETPTCVS